MSAFEPETEILAASVPADAPTEEVVPEAPPRPRIRWAGIVWGFVLAAVAATGAAAIWPPGSLDDLAMIVSQLDATTLVAGALMVLGALALIAGLVGLLRHAQRASERRGA